MKLAGLLILTCGMAAGQKPCTDGINVCTDHSMTLAAPIEGTAPSLPNGAKGIWTSPDHVLHLEGSWCENSIRVGSTTKSVKELFPNECAPNRGEAPHRLPLFTPLTLEEGHLAGGVPVSDVPAIQVDDPGNEPLVLRDPNNCVDGWMQNVLYGNHCASRKYWACADKARILLTAEDGKKHCIKLN